MNKISTEKAIEVLYTVRDYYASLTVGYPKGEDCKGIEDVTCSEIANSCLKAIKVLEQEPCLEAVSKQAILDAFWKLDIELRPSVIDAILNMINDLPPVNPQPKTGHWIQTEEKDDAEPFILWECSCCHKEFRSVVHKVSNYCPNCGVKMVEPQESEGNV